MRILIVEDEVRMLELLHGELTNSGHTVTTVSNEGDGLNLALAHEFDAIAIDEALHGRGGLSVVESLRHRSCRPAIVMLTGPNKAGGMADEREAGADDYVTRALPMPDLVARIADAVRRVRMASGEHFSFGPFHLDLSRRRLLCHGEEVQITRSEYLLLRTLAMRRGLTVSHRQLIQAVWGATVVSHGSLEALVNGLRTKLDFEQPGLISTIPGAGYALPEDANPGRASAR